MKALLALATLILISGSCWAEGTKFSVKTTEARNTIQFVSDAPLERIVGRTDEGSGEITLDLSDIAGSASGTIRVPLGKLDTGLSLRNEHMRQNHLETGKYPEVVFRIREFISADPPAIIGGGSASTLIKGELELHGVKKDYEILGQLNYDPLTGILNARYHWPISLKEHQIARPDFLFMKLSDTQEISVDIDFSR